jgi:hypothetical protein
MIVETSANGRSSDAELGRCTDQQQEPKHFKGEIMKNRYASILLTLIFLLGLGVAAKAELRRQIVVTLPFAFVVSGKTFPAGTYTLSRFSDEKSEGLILSSNEHGTSVFVHPVEVESTRGDNPSVSFKLVGEQHFLSKIQTRNDVYNIPVSRSVIVEAAERSRDNGSASGSSGSN